MSGGDDERLGWVEVGERCFVRRYDSFDLSIGVVEGSDGLAVVDTRASLAEGRALRADVRRLSALPVRAVVNTHVHFDHTFGNAAFVDVPVVAHESVAVSLPRHREWLVGEIEAHPDDDPRNAEMTSTPVRIPDVTFSSVSTLQLGDRVLELVHPGRGHTDGDVVVRVVDADVVYAGDLIEQSEHPSYGEDCWPLEWPATLELLEQLVGASTVLVPGHGTPVDQAFLRDQRGDVATVAGQLRELAGQGLGVDAALRAGSWPYPAQDLRTAVERGLAQLRA